MNYLLNLKKVHLCIYKKKHKKVITDLESYGFVLDEELTQQSMKEVNEHDLKDKQIIYFMERSMHRDVKVSVRMFLDDFIDDSKPLRDYVIYYLQKIEQTLKLRVHHVFVYDKVDTIKVKEFSDFVLDKLTHKTEIITIEKLDPKTYMDEY